MPDNRDDQPSTTGAPTSDQVRHRIDSGKKGDKVDYPDPAAAPLGTDDEAAGAPPGPDRRKTAQSPGPSIEGKELPVAYGEGSGGWRVVGLIVALALMLAAGLLVFSWSN